MAVYPTLELNYIYHWNYLVRKKHSIINSKYSEFLINRLLLYTENIFLLFPFIPTKKLNRDSNESNKHSR